MRQTSDQDVSPCSWAYAAAAVRDGTSSLTQMSLDRLLAQHQYTCNVGVAPPFGHQPQHLHLPRGETGGACSSQQLVDLLGCRCRTQSGKGAACDSQLCGRRVFVTHLTQCTREDNACPRSLVR